MPHPTLPGSSVPSSRLSPKSTVPKPNPNINPFASLSPDLPADQLLDSHGGRPGRHLQYYTRTRLLQIARTCQNRGWTIPPDMGALETWYGPSSPSSSRAQPVDDPAIASIGPPGGSTRRGGYGEGFGFGGGIGGRGFGRVGRNVGLRRPNDLNPLHEKPSAGSRNNAKGTGKPAEERAPHIEYSNRRRDDFDWRKDKAGPPPSRPHLDEAEPAWMDDAAEIDSAIASADPLVHFTPGEDMIAKHKQAMKNRDAGTLWRMPDQAVEMKAKSFNMADYLLPSKSSISESQTPAAVEEPPQNAFTSRFQRFFAAEQPPPQQLDTYMPRPNEQRPPDDHATRLMGLLSMNSRGPAPPPIRGPAPPPPSAPGPSYPPSNSQHLLQQLYMPPPPRPPPDFSHPPLPPMIPPHIQYQGPPRDYANPIINPMQIPPGVNLPPYVAQHIPNSDQNTRQQAVLQTLFSGLSPQR